MCFVIMILSLKYKDIIMMNIIYIKDVHKDPAVKSQLIDYAKAKGLVVDECITTQSEDVKSWDRSPLFVALNAAEPGSNIIIYDAAQLGTSTFQILNLFEIALARKVNMHFVKYDQVLDVQNNDFDALALLKIVYQVESDFINRRTSNALKRRLESGRPLGRPKGRKNKQLKLDRYEEDIMRYLALGVSKASVARLVSCHPQTLYGWLERKKRMSEEGVA